MLLMSDTQIDDGDWALSISHAYVRWLVFGFFINSLNLANIIEKLKCSSCILSTIFPTKISLFALLLNFNQFKARLQSLSINMLIQNSKKQLPNLKINEKQLGFFREFCTELNFAGKFRWNFRHVELKLLKYLEISIVQQKNRMKSFRYWNTSIFLSVDAFVCSILKLMQALLQK